MVENLEEWLAKIGTKLPNKVTTLIRNYYRAELDETNDTPQHPNIDPNAFNGISKGSFREKYRDTK